MVQVPGPIIMQFNGIWLRGELILCYYFGGSGAELKKKRKKFKIILILAETKFSSQEKKSCPFSLYKLML